MLRHRREHQHWLLGRLLGLGLPLCAYLTQQNGPRVSENGVVTLGVTCQVLHKISCCHTELTLSRTPGWRNLQLAPPVHWLLEKNLHTCLGSSLSFFQSLVLVRDLSVLELIFLLVIDFSIIILLLDTLQVDTSTARSDVC